MDRLSFKFGFPNWIQTQENILKPRIVLTDLVVGSYELFTSGYVVFRQLENTVLIIKKEYKMKSVLYGISKDGTKCNYKSIHVFY